MRKHLLGIASGFVLLACAAGAATADEYIWKDGKWVRAAKPAEGSVAGELALIRRHIAEGRRKDALRAVETFRNRHPDDPACEEAMLLAGEAEMGAGRYYQAYEAFERMLNAYPNGRFLERALLREMDVANAFLAGKKRIVAKVFRLPARDEGLTILRRIAEHAPGSVVAEKALLRIGEYHAARGEYAEASEAYDNYLQLFGKSRRAPEAMLQAAVAMYASFKGVAYDETPLIEAEQRLKALLDQYPHAARKAGAPRMLDEITRRRARRAYETARFYQRTGRAKSARFYYRLVAEKYPSSAWAGDARRFLGRDAPPAPPTPTPPPAPTAPARAATAPPAAAPVEASQPSSKAGHQP